MSFPHLFSCKKEKNSNNSSSYNIYQETKPASEYYPDGDDNDSSLNGTYCAEVEYYNPNTGIRKTYDLDVEVEDGYLVQINWPNGGWLDGTHFSSEDISSGECSFRSDRGYRYTVRLGERGGGCYNEGYQLQNDINEDVQNTTCPRCGNEKYEYDTYCSNCQNETEENSNGE